MSARDSELAKGWFQKAEQDLFAADSLMQLEAPPFSVICFHYQQAAEKYLKGFLAFHGQQFVRTHDLLALLDLCVRLAPAMAALRSPSSHLTDYAVSVRYPSIEAEPLRRDAEEAQADARCIKAAVLSSLPEA